MGRPLGRALSVSVALHGAMAAAILALLAVRAERVASQTPTPKLNLVYIARSTSPAVGGGGGRAGDSAPGPVQIAPHRPPVVVTAVPDQLPTADPLPTLSALVEATSPMFQANGVSLSAPPGPGDRGRGSGVGSGQDGGIGPGSKGDSGGGPSIPGQDGVTVPAVIREVKPDYSPEALQARVQGAVMLEVLVLANGTVGRATVLKSPHPSLNAKAIEAARKWLFRPSTRNGQPVDVLVTLILDFRLH